MNFWTENKIVVPVVSVAGTGKFFKKEVEIKENENWEKSFNLEIQMTIRDLLEYINTSQNTRAFKKIRRKGNRLVIIFH